MALMPSADAPAVTFTEEELRHLRDLRATFLRSHGARSKEIFLPPPPIRWWERHEE